MKIHGPQITGSLNVSGSSSDVFDFDDRRMFDALRVSFLCAVLGENCIDLQDLLANVLDHSDASINIDALLTYCIEVWAALASTPLEDGPIPYYYEEAWPILRECMVTEDRQYYFSV